MTGAVQWDSLLWSRILIWWINLLSATFHILCKKIFHWMMNDKTICFKFRLSNYSSELILKSLELYILQLWICRGFRKVLESSFKQFIMSWYMFFFQLPFLPEIFLKHDDFTIVDMFFNKQHLPDVSRQVMCHYHLLKLLQLIVKKVTIPILLL